MINKRRDEKILTKIVFKVIIILYIIFGFLFGFIIDQNPLGLFTKWWLLFIGTVIMLINTLITIIHFRRMSIHFVTNCILNIILAILLYSLFRSII